MRIPSFVAVVQMPYTPTAANPHHHSHRIATLDVSIVRCFTCDIAGIDGILLEIASLARETRDATDGICGILSEIPSLARTRTEFDAERIESRIRLTEPCATAFADSPLSSIPFLNFSRASRAPPSIAFLASTAVLAARCRASYDVAFEAADFNPFVALSDAREAPSPAPDAAERRESRSLSHLEFDEKDIPDDAAAAACATQRCSLRDACIRPR